MKNTLKDLYDINAKSLLKYTNKVYKVKSDDNNEYCLKYSDNEINNKVVEKINTLKLNDSFVMPLKTCIRNIRAKKDERYFYMSEWVEDDLIESKDLKIKFYLNQLANMHLKTLYTTNVSSTYFSELTMQIEESIQESYQKYDAIIYSIERKEYKSPFEWYFVYNYKNIIESLDKSKKYLNKLKELTKNKSTIRQTITHQNFSYDHVFISKNKIIGNDRIKISPPIFDLIYLFNYISYGNIDLSGIINEYLNVFKLEEYEIYWMLSLLYIVDFIQFNDNEFNNINSFMKLLFKYKCISEIEELLITKK